MRQASTIASSCLLTDSDPEQLAMEAGMSPSEQCGHVLDVSEPESSGSASKRAKMSRNLAIQSGETEHESMLVQHQEVDLGRLVDSSAYFSMSSQWSTSEKSTRLEEPMEDVISDCSREGIRKFSTLHQLVCIKHDEIDKILVEKVTVPVGQVASFCERVSGLENYCGEDGKVCLQFDCLNQTEVYVVGFYGSKKVMKEIFCS